MSSRRLCALVALLALSLLGCATDARAQELQTQPDLQTQPQPPAAAVPAAVPGAQPLANDAAPAPAPVAEAVAASPAPAPVAALRVPVPKVTEAEFEALAHSGMPVFVKFYAPSAF